MKKEAHQKQKGLNKTISDEKRGAQKNVNAAHEQKAKPASLTKRSKARVTLFGLIIRSQTNVATEAKKTSNHPSTEVVFGILKIEAVLRFKNNLCTQITRRRFHDKLHKGNFTKNHPKVISQQDSTHATSHK
jgi:hypothetical protein